MRSILLSNQVVFRRLLSDTSTTRTRPSALLHAYRKCTESPGPVEGNGPEVEERSRTSARARAAIFLCSEVSVSCAGSSVGKLFSSSLLMSCRKPELNALQECGKSWWLQPRLETDPLQTLQLASCSGGIIISPQHKRTLDAAREQERLDSITNVPEGAKFVDNASAERTSSCNAPAPRTPPLLTRRRCCYQTVREGEWMCATAAAEGRDERCCERSTRGAWPTEQVVSGSAPRPPHLKSASKWLLRRGGLGTASRWRRRWRCAPKRTELPCAVQQSL